MNVKEMKEFLNKYNDDMKIYFGVVNGETGEWYDFNIMSLCATKELGENSIEIQFEENKRYNREKSESIIDNLREDIITLIDGY